MAALNLLSELLDTAKTEEYVGFGEGFQDLKAAVESSSTTMPEGLIFDREAFRKWMKENAA